MDIAPLLLAVVLAGSWRAAALTAQTGDNDGIPFSTTSSARVDSTDPSGIHAQLSATDSIDPSGATALRPGRPIGLRVVGTAPIPPNLQLPIEVLVPYSVVESRFPLPSRGDKLWAQIYGVLHANKGSVQINDGPWIDLNNENVIVAEPGRSFGGIGGGFATLFMTIPSADFAPGENIVRWRFNEANHGIRILDFNVLSGTNRLVPANLFSRDDPARWTAPLTNARDVAAGKSLWLNKPLPGFSVHCGDCHTRDGRDLKYFNFSNLAISVQAAKLGFNELEQQQLVSYIRSLPVQVPAQARPWNPPYQPGPGMDSRPIHEWAAGAGLEAVLPRDQDTLNYLFPFKTRETLNAREVPLAIQFPDWRRWLPLSNPIENFGTNFTKHPFFLQYGKIRSLMKTNDPASARLLRTLEADWYNFAFDFFGRSGKPAVPIPPRPWPEDFQRKVLGAHQWHLVKLWEIMTEFRLEGFGVEVFGAQANARSWLGQRVFNVAPHLIQLETKTIPINGSGSVVWDYYSMAWYQLQVTLNNSNRRNYGSGPIDFGYLDNLCMTPARPNAGMAGVLMVNLITAAQQCDNGVSVENTLSGWAPRDKANAHLLVPEGHHANVWRQVPAAQRKAIIETYLREWLIKCESYTPAQYYKAGLAESRQIAGTDVMGGKWLDRYWAMTVNCKARNIDPDLMRRLADFGASLWPANNWAQFRP